MLGGSGDRGFGDQASVQHRDCAALEHHSEEHTRLPGCDTGQMDVPMLVQLPRALLASWPRVQSAPQIAVDGSFVQVGPHILGDTRQMRNLNCKKYP